MKVISNSSPLIYLSKIGKIFLLQKLFDEVFIPKEVFDEISLGKAAGFSGALIIEEAIEDGWIKIMEIKPDEKLVRFARELDIGEAAVLTLARKMDPGLVLMDDASGRSIAESFGFNVKGTIYVLLKAYRNELESKQAVKDSIDNLIHAGFRISTELYARILRELE